MQIPAAVNDSGGSLGELAAQVCTFEGEEDVHETPSSYNPLDDLFFLV